MLATAEVVYAKIEDTLNRALALVGRVDELYRLGGDQVRRLANQCFLDKLLISVDEDTAQVTGATLHEPWGTLLAHDFERCMARNAANPGQDLSGRGSQ